MLVNDLTTIGAGGVSFAAIEFREDASDDVDTRDSESCGIGFVLAPASSSVSEAVDESSMTTSTFRCVNWSFLSPHFLLLFAGALSSGPNGELDVSALDLSSASST